MKPRVTVTNRDWKSVANLGLIPVAVFSFVLGFVEFGWLFLPIIAAVLVGTSALLWLVQRMQQREEPLGYVVPASIARRTGRLHLDTDGMSWSPYRGDVELRLPWEDVGEITIQPVAAGCRAVECEQTRPRLRKPSS